MFAVCVVMNTLGLPGLVPGIRDESLARMITMRQRAARWLPTPRSSPLATATVAMLVMTALLLHTRPNDTDDIVAWASTNLDNLARHPVSSMIASAFVVPGGLLPDLAVVAIALSVLERAIGARRTALVALTGHVVATLLTEYGAYLAVQLNLLAGSPSDRPDVGVSCLMYSALAGCLLLLPRRAMVFATTLLGGYVLVPFSLDPGLTTTGHVLSVLIGVTTMSLLQRRAAPLSSGPATQPATLC